MSVEAIGDSIARRYRIIDKIGGGGMGSVYKALDTRLQRLVALKVLHFKGDSKSQESKQLFLWEKVALGRLLNHPNIVQIYEVGETETFVYMALEYVEGRTLDQFVAGAKPLDLDYAIEIICKVGMALSYAHQRGVIHRDVKPSNILISNDGRVLLLDFGLATAPRASTLAQTRTIVGTPAYMSPEQAMGKVVDGRSDIFSLGVVLYELLTGTRPFVGSSTSEVIRRLCEEAPTEPQEINPSVPSSSAGIVLKCLAKQPEQRFQTADKFLSALLEAKPRRALSLLRTPSGAKPFFVLLAVGRRLSSRVVAATLAIFILLLLSFGFVLLRGGTKPVSSGSSSAARESWFSHYGLSLLAVAGAVLVLGFVWRLYAARNGPSQAKVVSSPTVSTSSARLDREVAVQADQAQPISLEEMVPQGGVGDRDPTAELLPYHPALTSEREELTHYQSLIPDSRVLAEATGMTPEVLAEANRLGVSPGILAEAKRLQEFNSIWDQLISSARHA